MKQNKTVEAKGLKILLWFEERKEKNLPLLWSFATLAFPIPVAILSPEQRRVDGQLAAASVHSHTHTPGRFFFFIAAVWVSFPPVGLVEELG